MKKRFIALFMCILTCSTTCLSESKKTTFSAEVYGWKHDMVDVQCVQTPLLSAEFHTNPGEEHLYSFETERLVCMLVNGRIPILLMPGDSLHAVIHYEGKNIRNIQFSGDTSAVNQNRLMADLNQLKVDMRFKQQLMTCLVLDTKPTARLADARTVHEKGTNIINVADNVPAEAKEYLLASLENDLYFSLMEYPQMYENGRKQPIAEQGIGDYWTLLGQWRPNPTKTMLDNPDYINLLMRYYIYDNERQAHNSGTTWTREENFEDIYAALAHYFTQAEVRDAVLYHLICNFIRRGQEIERVDPIMKDYKEKYNGTPAYTEILESLLQ